MHIFPTLYHIKRHFDHIKKYLFGLQKTHIFPSVVHCIYWTLLNPKQNSFVAFSLHCLTIFSYSSANLVWESDINSNLFNHKVKRLSNDAGKSRKYQPFFKLKKKISTYKRRDQILLDKLWVYSPYLGPWISSAYPPEICTPNDSSGTVFPLVKAPPFLPSDQPNPSRFPRQNLPPFSVLRLTGFRGNRDRCHWGGFLLIACQLVPPRDWLAHRGEPPREKWGLITSCCCSTLPCQDKIVIKESSRLACPWVSQYSMALTGFYHRLCVPQFIAQEACWVSRPLKNLWPFFQVQGYK